MSTLLLLLSGITEAECYLLPLTHLRRYHVLPHVLKEVHGHGCSDEEHGLAILHHVAEVIVLDQVLGCVSVLHAIVWPEDGVQNLVPGGGVRELFLVFCTFGSGWFEMGSYNSASYIMAEGMLDFGESKLVCSCT